MAKSYLEDKKKKKKSALNVVWILLALGVIFIIIVVKLAFSNSIDAIITGMPSSDDVYSMAKVFIKPTLKSSEVDFSDGQYEFGKKADSVFVIKSYVKIKDNAGEEQKTNFEIVLKYKGGSKDSQKNWELINLNED